MSGSQKYFRPEHLIAGVSGGLLSVLLTHPLELVKVRFQVDDLKRSSRRVSATSFRPAYKGVFNAFSTIYRSGGVRGLYGGVTPSLVGSGSAWGLYFLIYNGLKSRRIENGAGQSKDGAGQSKLDAHRSKFDATQSRKNCAITGAGPQNTNAGRDLTLIEHLTLAGQTGLVTLTLTNPIWVAKTRLCLQYEKNTSALNSPASAKGMKEVLSSLWKNEGVRGLYRGYFPGIIGISHGVVQFVSYEEMKKRYCRRRGLASNSKLGTTEYLLFSSLSKLVAAGLTYPYQVVRSRLQEQHRKYSGVKDVILNIARTEGVYGFYKGLLPCLLRVVPATAITFVTYENVVRLLA